MRVIPYLALLPLTLALGGCAIGGGAPYDATADKAAVQSVITSAWKAEYADDEDTACLYFTTKFIEEQNRIWEAGTPGSSPRGADCASGSHPYLRFTNIPSGLDNDGVRFAWTRVSHKSGTATAHPILPGELSCLSADCHVVMSLVIHLVDKKGAWLIDGLDASACEEGGSCVPLTDRADI